LSGSFVTFAQMPPQFREGAEQVFEHLPLLQNSPPVQMVPQAPQLLGSLSVLVQVPLQLVCPVWQAHCEFVQTPLGHMLLQLPQA
jgi:hypothetical protein